MTFDNETLQRVFDRTDGHCHICRRRLAYSNYGQIGKRGAWEVEHSIARSNGGTDRLSNLYPAHIACNRSKGIRHSTSARGAHGFRCAPLSAAKKRKNAVKGGLLGGLLGLIFMPPQIRIPVALFAAIAGATIGAKHGPR